MKKYVIIVFAMFQIASYSQDLMSKYKTGTVRLVPDLEYAQSNDWNTIFRSHDDILYNKPVGMRKSLVLLPDGSAVVSHAYRNYHTKFSPTGKFEEEIVIDKAGHQSVLGVLNKNTLFTNPDNTGKMICSDLNGKFIKTLTLDYIAKDIIALSNKKFAVVGWVLWSEEIRLFVSIVDYETNSEKVIWDHFINRSFSSRGKVLNNRKPFNYTIELKDGGLASFNTMPYSKSTGTGIPPQITIVKNELLIAIPNTGEILVYDLNGNLKSKSKIGWPNTSLSVGEQKAIQQKAIDRYREYIENGDEFVQENLSAYNQVIAYMEEDLENINTPMEKPSFSNIITDSDGNVLFFEIPEEKNANIFHVWVHDQEGQFVTKCTFVCDEYELNISSSKMVFRDGYIYALQNLKRKEAIPIRLVRFKLDAN